MTSQATPAGHVGRLLGMLDGVRASGDSWMARCPVHDDRQASLSVSVGNDGRALMKCHAGCAAPAVLGALGLQWRDLFPRPDGMPGNGRHKAGDLKVYAIRDHDGHLVAEHVREETPAGKKLWWRRPGGERGLGGIRVADLPLYGAELLGDRPDDAVVVVEGEKAALAARRLNVLALGTVTGAGTVPSDASLQPLLGRDAILWPDADAPGALHMARIAARLVALGQEAERVRVVTWPNGTPQGNDAADVGDDEGRALLAGATVQATTEGPKDRAVVVTRACDIAPVPVTWTWEEHIPSGMLALVAGREGTGKSSMVLERSSRLTRGDLKGVHYGRPRSVVVVAAEDSWQHTVVPRLMAAGADLTRVLRVQIRTRDLGTCELSLPDDVDALRGTIRDHDVALVMLDPLVSRLASRLDTHRDGEVRQGLEPLARLADETGAAVVGLIHVSKATTRDPLTAILGSRGFVAVARAVLSVVQDPDDRRRRIVSQTKCNVGRDDSSGLPSLTYRVDGATIETALGPAQTSCVVWTGETDRGVREIMAAQDAGSGESGARQAAEAWLRDVLAAGPTASEDIQAQAKAAGLSWRTVRRAQEALRIKPAKAGGRFGGDPRWYWELPANPTLAPEDGQAHLKVANKEAWTSSVEVGHLQAGAPADPSTYEKDGITYRKGDTLPDGRLVLDVDDGIPTLRKPAVPAEAEVIQ